MAFLAALGPAIGAISGAIGIATGIKSLLSKPKEAAKAPAPEPRPIPKAPTVEDAQKKAQGQVARRRRISLLSGGETNVTGGKATLQEGDVGRKSLLGA